MNPAYLCLPPCELLDLVVQVIAVEAEVLQVIWDLVFAGGGSNVRRIWIILWYIGIFYRSRLVRMDFRAVFNGYWNGSLVLELCL